MRIHGADIISRSTQNTSRFLFLLSGSIIAIHRYDLNSEKWTILGENRHIQPEQFSEIALVLLLFAVLSHLAHWYPDYVAYTKWFRKNEVPIAGWFEQSAAGRSEPVVAAIKRDLESLSESNEANKGLREKVENVEKLLMNLGPNFRQMSYASRFVVFGWYLSFPLGLALVAICLTH